MNLLILTRFPEEYEPTRLREEAENLGLKSLVLSYKKITIKDNDVVLDNDKCSLSQFEYVVPRAASGPSGSLVKQKTTLLKKLSGNQFCLNKESFLKYPLTGKILQSEIFKNVIPAVTSRVFHQEKDWESFLEKAEFPLMVKGAFGSHGEQVFAVDNKTRAEEIISQQNWQKLIFSTSHQLPLLGQGISFKRKIFRGYPQKNKIKVFAGKRSKSSRKT